MRCRYCDNKSIGSFPVLGNNRINDIYLKDTKGNLITEEMCREHYEAKGRGAVNISLDMFPPADMTSFNPDNTSQRKYEQAIYDIRKELLKIPLSGVLPIADIMKVQPMTPVVAESEVDAIRVQQTGVYDVTYPSGLKKMINLDKGEIIPAEYEYALNVEKTKLGDRILLTPEESQMIADAMGCVSGHNGPITSDSVPAPQDYEWESEIEGQLDAKYQGGPVHVEIEPLPADSLRWIAERFSGWDIKSYENGGYLFSTQ